MRILLDTHIFIWMATEPERLSSRFTESIIDRQNSLFLSLASIWEIQIKVALGKLDLERRSCNNRRHSDRAEFYSVTFVGIACRR